MKLANTISILCAVLTLATGCKSAKDIVFADDYQRWSYTIYTFIIAIILQKNI